MCHDTGQYLQCSVVELAVAVASSTRATSNRWTADVKCDAVTTEDSVQRVRVGSRETIPYSLSRR